jgi:hypothetical protein
MEIEELWAQFKSETTESSKLYKQEVIQHAGWRERSWKRPFKVLGRLCWNILKKLSPARRLFLLDQRKPRHAGDSRFAFPDLYSDD